MPKVLYELLIILSVWLGLSPWIFGVTTSIDIGVALAIALFVIVFSFIGIKKGAKYAPGVIIALGIGLTIWAITSALIGKVGVGIIIDEIIVGLLFMFLAYFVTQLFVFPYVSAVDRTGDVLTTISNVKVKNGVIVMNAVLLGNMRETIIINPEEVWKMLPLIESNVVSALPGILYKGWKETRKLVKEQSADKASIN